jgi:glycerol transport system ATP-binding protein
MAKIHLNAIAHSYLPNPSGPDDYALKEMEHVWEDGKTYALLGPSGCGKTTLLNIISGLLIPSDGNVLFGKDDVTTLPTEDRNIAQVFQFPVIYDTMSVRQNLAFPLKNRGESTETVNTRVEEIAGMLGLTDQLDSRALNLSSDAKQIISLGRGLVRDDVNAILFDEPLTMIDPHKKWLLRSKLKELHQEFGFTMVYVTHDQTEAMTFADHVVVMKDGEILQVGTPKELFERPRHTFVGHFIGSPGMNFLPVSLNGKEAIFNDQPIKLAHDFGTDTSDEIMLGIRPEFINISPLDNTGITMRVTNIEDLGKHKIIRMAIGDHTLSAIISEEMEISTNEVSVSFTPENTLIYRNNLLIEKDK